ncbi:mCG1035226 [Mus musculus]|nr:mCG1035226 [Mus musculus]
MTGPAPLRQWPDRRGEERMTRRNTPLERWRRAGAGFPWRFPAACCGESIKVPPYPSGTGQPRSCLSELTYLFYVYEPITDG